VALDLPVIKSDSFNDATNRFKLIHFYEEDVDEWELGAPKIDPASTDIRRLSPRTRLPTR
jgi:hypothetical protein